MCGKECTDITQDPVVSGKNGCLGIFHCGHELLKRSSEGGVLLRFVDDDTTLEPSV
jgi:hypothetical protein